MSEFTLPEKFKDAIDILGNQKVYKLITKEGDASPSRATKNTTAQIHYTGTLLDGTKFDSSRDRGQPFETPVGVGRVIKGWDAVMPTMAKNERCEVLIAPDFAYGEHGSPPTIPGNSHLIFDMEMLDWYGEDISEGSDKSLTKVVLQKGTGADDGADGSDDDEGVDSSDNSPSINNKVKINIQKNDEPTIENFEYILGEEELYDELSKEPAILTCLKSMKVGEKSEFSVKKNGNKFTIELVMFYAKKGHYDMTAEEIFEAEEETKSRATELFKNGHLKVALAKYNLLQENFDTFKQRINVDQENQEEVQSKHQKFKIAIYSNIALINLKLKDANEAIDACACVLELDEKNEKATFRIAEAHKIMGNTDEAIEWYGKVLEINAENKAARNGMIGAKKLKKELFEKEKKKYSKMFG